MGTSPKAYQLSLSTLAAFGGAWLTTLPAATPGVSLILDGSQTTGAVTCQLNGDAACVITLNAGQTLGFGKNDITVTSVDWENATSGATQAVQFVVGLVPADQAGSLS